MNMNPFWVLGVSIPNLSYMHRPAGVQHQLCHLHERWPEPGLELEEPGLPGML